MRLLFNLSGNAIAPHVDSRASRHDIEQVSFVDGCMETFCSLMICLSLVACIANVLAMPRLCGAGGFEHVDGVLPSFLRLGRCWEHFAIGRYQGGFHQHVQGQTALHRMDLASLLDDDCCDVEPDVGDQTVSCAASTSVACCEMHSCPGFAVGCPENTRDVP